VHIWQLPLSLQPLQLDTLGKLLAEDETAQAERFRFPEHRRRFIARRGSARIILGRYLDIPPESLEFDRGTNGKPTLRADTSSPLPTFNLSHSQELALLAVGQGRDIGVDLERIDSKLADTKIAEHQFARIEKEALEQMADAQWLEAFFHCWCRKEAFIKAVGKGLSLPLDLFAVSVEPHGAAKLIACDPSLGLRRSDWALFNLAAIPNYATALAVKGPAPVLRHFKGQV